MYVSYLKDTHYSNVEIRIGVSKSNKVEWI